MARKRDNNTSNTSLTSLLRPASMVSPSTLDPIRRLVSHPVDILVGDITDDLREYHPLGTRRPAQTATGQVATIKRTYNSITHNIGYNDPENVTTCIRRSIRRETLFALNRQLRKGQSGGRYRRNYRSKIKC